MGSFDNCSIFLSLVTSFYFVLTALTFFQIFSLMKTNFQICLLSTIAINHVRPFKEN